MKQTETFCEFCNELRGYRIINKKGFEVPKYIAYWKGLNAIQIKERFTLQKR
jgi:hypothetical protein